MGVILQCTVVPVGRGYAIMGLGLGSNTFVGLLAPQPRLGTEVLRGSFLVKESVLGSEVCFKLSAVAVLVDRFLVKAPCFLWTW